MLRTLTTIMLTLAFVIAGAATSALLLAQDAAQPKETRSSAQAAEAEEEEPAPVLYLGFRTSPVADGSGMLVLNVVFGSPFHAAGIQPDDVIVMMNGQSVKSADDVSGAISGLNPGDEIRVKYERGQNSSSTNVTVEERHDGMDFALYGINGFAETTEPTVQAVAPDMAAEAGGLKAGDVFVKLNNNKVDNIDQVTGYLGATRPGDRTIFTIKRGDKTLDIIITAGHK